MSETKRSTWGSSAAFILAAIGSAVGLGNAWRFPNLAAKHGGGAFLLVYLLAMLIIGIPLLMMEISIGRKMHSGAPGALRKMNKKFEPIGWAATSNAFVIVTYYAVVFAWVIMMAVFSFKFVGMTGNNEAAGGLFQKFRRYALPMGQFLFQTDGACELSETFDHLFRGVPRKNICQFHGAFSDLGIGKVIFPCRRQKYGDRFSVRDPSEPRKTAQMRYSGRFEADCHAA